MVNRHMKDAQHHESSGKCKSKPQWDTTSHMSEWLLTKRQQIISVGEDMEKKEPLDTVGGNVNWYSNYGKEYGSSSKNSK